MGDLTPEVLQALGLDAQRFVDLGFFDTASGNPPASDPPPPPSADSTPPATNGASLVTKPARVAAARGKD